LATSKCGKCDGTTFEMTRNSVHGSDYKIMFVQCATCGTVVGITDYYNVPSLLIKLAEGLEVSLGVE
jgi:hypothetical protein